MNQEPEITPEAAKAIHAAKNAAQAVEESRQAQFDHATNTAAEKAADLASQKISDKIIDEGRMALIIKEQLENVLATGSEQEKTMILARVKYICQDVKDINANLQKLTDLLSTYPVVKALVFGGAGMILTAVVGALIALVVIQ